MSYLLSWGKRPWESLGESKKPRPSVVGTWLRTLPSLS
jgi:hypothetical protein